MIRLQRILFPTDFSQSSQAAETYACELARQFGAELHVLYVLQDVTLAMPEPGSVFAMPALNLDEVQQSAQQVLSTVPAASWPQARIVRHTSRGAPWAEIIRIATENRMDLIVMGTHGRSGLPHVLLGSVAEKVVRHAGCPV